MATIRFFIKPIPKKEGNSETSKPQFVFFRYRPSRQLDLILQTPEKILAENWDAKNQCWYKDQITKGAKTQETKTLNFDIETFNRKLEDFSTTV